ncbi:hypothetical protein H9N25_00765 [Pedobacter riviphilus]|uniref:AbiTii domain-containing protein n=1 Tax=Pedobacter riviphilus TaxID=2766984 RepID=A0ABX6TJG6_9SPHI|nr:hypothetical protein [Pedobacter riviphilus]QNR85075.1 hypothetical protein H9N25_00765 [Pedobacter riviphilus]
MERNQTFLLQQVIDDLLDPTLSVEAPLLKLKYFALLVKNSKLAAYTDLEINGYKDAKILPRYRQGLAALTINLQVGIDNYKKELPISMIEKPYASQLKYLPVPEGIKVIEFMIAKSGQKSDLITVAFPMESLHLLQGPAGKLYRTNLRPTVTEAWLTTNANILVQIPSTVRSRLLAFTMDIAESFGFDIQISKFKGNQIENNQIINNYFRNEIINQGDRNIVNTGNGSSLKGK